MAGAGGRARRGRGPAGRHSREAVVTPSPTRPVRLVVTVCPREPGVVRPGEARRPGPPARRDEHPASPRSTRRGARAAARVRLQVGCAGGCGGPGPNVSVTIYPLRAPTTAKTTSPPPGKPTSTPSHPDQPVHNPRRQPLTESVPLERDRQLVRSEAVKQETAAVSTGRLAVRARASPAQSCSGGGREEHAEGDATTVGRGPSRPPPS